MHSSIKIIIGIISVIILFWQLFSSKPFIPTIYSWIMKIPNSIQKWTVGLLALAMLVFICWKSATPPTVIKPGASSQAPTLLLQTSTIPDTDTNLDAAYEKYNEQRDDLKLCGYGNNLFETNNFAYSKLFLGLARDKYIDIQGRTSVNCDGYYQAACLAQNPTLQGWQEFTNSLIVLVKNITEDIDKEKHGEGGLINKYYTHSGRLATISKHLGVAMEKLPDSQKPFVLAIKKQIDALILQAPNQDNL